MLRIYTLHVRTVTCLASYIRTASFLCLLSLCHCAQQDSIMDTDFDECLQALNNSEDEASDSEAAGSPQASESAQASSGSKRKSLGTASAKSGGSKAKKQKQSKAKDDREGMCFIATCENKKLAKSKFCKVDKAAVDAILYQAEKKGAAVKAKVEAVLSDPVQCAKAVADFHKENPPGRFRKKLIEFSQWLKTYSIEKSITERDAVELFSFQDFSDDKTKAGWTPQNILSKWQEHLNNPAIEQEGESLWLPLRKQKMRDTTRKISNAYVESSKAIKNPKESDAADLKQFASDSAAAFTDSFLTGDNKKRERNPSSVASLMRSAGEDEAERPAESEAENNNKTKNKKKKVDLANALATFHERGNAKLTRLKDLFSTALTAAKDAMERAKKQDSLSESGKLFEKTCSIRRACAELWMMENQEKLDAWLAANPSSAAARALACVVVRSSVVSLLYCYDG